MKRTKLIALVLLGIACAALLSVGLVRARAATANDNTPAISDEAAYKLAHDTDPHLPLTPEQQEILKLKDAAIAARLAGRIEEAEALDQEVLVLGNAYWPSLDE